MKSTILNIGSVLTAGWNMMGTDTQVIMGILVALSMIILNGIKIYQRIKNKNKPDEKQS